MCGIAGFLTRKTSPADHHERIVAMTRTLKHRGPDSEGFWTDPVRGVALGHRRLAVVDLSPAGHQPMQSESGRFVLTYNGEIYNFLDLRKELDDVQFRGHSDTEVILACFERWGVVNSLGRLNGMFALAVWDRLEEILYLARDPLGEKPLYYSWVSDTLLFGSELKALRQHPAFPGRIDRNVLPLYLRYNCIPAPYSIYENVFKLPPGGFLTVRAGAWRMHTGSYWRLSDVIERAASNPIRSSDEEAIEAFDELLSDAVKRRTIADVPLGALLSGGIDSSAVVALMQRTSTNAVRTFTIGFHEDAYNEAVAAKAVAKHLGTDHTELYVTPAEAQAVVPQLPMLYDEPFADSSQIPTFLVSALARRDVTVSLSGDGGDELFGGYSRYARALSLRRRLSWIPGPMRRILGARLDPERGYRLQKLSTVAPIQDAREFYDALQWRCYNTAGIVRGAAELSVPMNLWPRCDDFLDQMMAIDTVSYLPDDILVKVDRASMGVSLESRIPLLDPRVVEFAWRLPQRMKIRGGVTKWILRQVLYKHVPAKLIDRPKRGFAVPVAGWLRGPLRAWADELLSEGRIGREGFFEARPIRLHWAEHYSGQRDHSSELWSVLMFQSWLENEARDRAAKVEMEGAPLVC